METIVSNNQFYLEQLPLDQKTFIESSFKVWTDFINKLLGVLHSA